MVDQQIVDYIKAAYARGTPLEKIRANLYANDWTELEVMQAEKMALVQPTVQPIAAQAPQTEKPAAKPVPVAAIAAVVIVVVIACAVVYFVFVNKDTGFGFASFLSPNDDSKTTIITKSLLPTPSITRAPTLIPTSTPSIVAAEQVRNCAGDKECLQIATLTCAKARYSDVQVSGIFSATFGSEVLGFNSEGLCELYSSVSTNGQTSDMTCLVPKEKLATWNDSPDSSYCNGSMLNDFDSQTPTPSVSIESNSVDCGKSISCLIDYASHNCSSAKVDFISSTPAVMFGETSKDVFINRSLFFNISQENGGCSVYSKLGSVVAYTNSSYENQMLSTGMTKAQFDAQLDLIELLSGGGLSGFDGVCEFALGSKAGEFLDLYPKNKFNSSSANCVGYLFGSQEIVANFTIERSCSVSISKKAGPSPYETIVNATLSLPAGSTIDYSCGEGAFEGQAMLLGGWTNALNATGQLAPVSHNYTTFDCVYSTAGNYSLKFTNDAGYDCSLNTHIGD